MEKSLTSNLDQKAIKWAHKIYWDKRFLEEAKIKNLNQTEKDRVFNELIVSVEILIMATLKMAGHEETTNEIAKVHSEFMKELGIEKVYRDTWKKLINMRFEEYERSKNDARMAMIEFESKEKDITSSDVGEINMLIPPFEIATICHKHILRGKTKGNDDLFKFIFKNMSRFYMEVNFVIAGKNVSYFAKNKVRLRHLWNDFKERFSKN
jgi:hypothetical protein